MIRCVTLRLALVASTLLAFSVHQAGAETASRWERWAVHDAASTAQVDHRAMTSILQYLEREERGEVRFAYSELRGQALKFVRDYIDYLERIPVTGLNRDEQLAYWLNLYNAGVIESIATHSGARKIKQNRGTPGQPGQWWAEKRFTVEGEDLSLEEIEQNILLGQWKDPNILYGLCYGVQGTPAPMPGEAFTGKNVHTRLGSAGRAFVNASSNVRVRKKGIEVSSLYAWNKALLFGDDDAALIAHLRSHADDRLARKLDGVSSVSKHKFSWSSLNYRPRNNNFNVTGAGGGGFGGGS